MTIYVSIGNSDNTLTQHEWAAFQDELFVYFEDQAHDDVVEIHGIWYSAPNSEFQNMCVCFDIMDTSGVSATVLKEVLRGLADAYKQESIAWAEAETTFLTPQ